MYISYCGEEVYRTGSANQNNLRQFSTRIQIMLVRYSGKLNQQFNLK